jgi:signal transduction histidine kinase
MDATQIDDARGAPFDELRAEASAALGSTANGIRSIIERYREAEGEEAARWHGLRDEIAGAGATGARLRGTLRAVDRLAAATEAHRAELTRLELVGRNLENTWLFLERGDASLVGEDAAAGLTLDQNMRIVQAQEAERTRLAQEVHDGPAQALSNAIFHVEYVERLIDGDLRAAHDELRLVRDRLRRELAEVRTFIGRLRPPVLDELGLEGSLVELAEGLAAALDIPVETDLRAATDRLGEAAQTVVLRIVQEALQNVRRHAAATRVTIVSRLEDDRWVVEVTDDGRGFDVASMATRGRRNFGLQFMRERAGLIGADFEVTSQPAGGTTVRLAIPEPEEGR